MDACLVTLDLTNNFDLTKLYLNLVSLYVRLIILLSRVEDRLDIPSVHLISHSRLMQRHTFYFGANTLF